jgi:DNA-directed RNA polymerase subunit beta'
VVGPQLQLNQCGLPKVLALELFKPFVMKRLAEKGHAQNIKSAKRMVERQRPQVWDVLSEVIQEHPVLLNRAPTLHRLGIQAFEPVLVEGKAIQIHPLVCEAFNADFDGDQMAVHLPLSAEAQAEARVLMLSTNNVLRPSNGRPVITPSQDMVIGMYYLSESVAADGELRVFGNIDEAGMAYDLGQLALHTPIRLRLGDRAGTAERHEQFKTALRGLITDEPVDGSKLFETTLGRAVINSAFPLDFPYINSALSKADIGRLIEVVIEHYPRTDVATTLDAIKDLGFRYATKAGLTIGLEDVKTPGNKAEILPGYEVMADKVQQQFLKGVMTEEERRQELIEIWTRATDDVKDAMEANLKSEKFNPLDMMVGSGARGNMLQVRQIAGMRGLVANPKGDIIPRPIVSNFREGLSVLEYFISTHGVRKGLADTALRTADSGYLTRRLVDVSQEVIIKQPDCETDKSIRVGTLDERGRPIRNLRSRVFGRVLADDVKVDRKIVENDEVKLSAGTLLGTKEMQLISATAGITELRVRSPLTCDAPLGICQQCYGLSLATGKQVELGEAVGIMAAQSIGEPGTQLTMRTFHTGGVAGEDITHGLPRVVELFEARTPKGKAVLAEVGGPVRIVDDDEGKRVLVDAKEGEAAYGVSRRARLRIADGETIDAGTQLTEGPLDPKEVLEVRGVRAAQQYLVDQVQEVYRSQGVEIHDKHIELIVRQMLRRIRVVNPGDSEFMPAELVDERDFREANRRLLEDEKQPAEGRTELMGITKASLATDSWLSAASFQETTRVLTDAAIFGKSDYMRGLKENVIIGRLIPAGTGAADYQSLQPNLPGATTVESLGWEFGPREREWTAEEAANWLRAGGSSDDGFDFAEGIDFDESAEDE